MKQQRNKRILCFLLLCLISSVQSCIGGGQGGCCGVPQSSPCVSGQAPACGASGGVITALGLQSGPVSSFQSVSGYGNGLDAQVPQGQVASGSGPQLMPIYGGAVDVQTISAAQQGASAQQRIAAPIASAPHTAKIAAPEIDYEEYEESRGSFSHPDANNPQVGAVYVPPVAQPRVVATTRRVSVAVTSRPLSLQPVWSPSPPVEDEGGYDPYSVPDADSASKPSSQNVPQTVHAEVPPVYAKNYNIETSATQISNQKSKPERTFPTLIEDKIGYPAEEVPHTRPQEPQRVEPVVTEDINGEEEVEYVYSDEVDPNETGRVEPIDPPQGEQEPSPSETLIQSGYPSDDSSFEKALADKIEAQAGNSVQGQDNQGLPEGTENQQMVESKVAPTSITDKVDLAVSSMQQKSDAGEPTADASTSEPEPPSNAVAQQRSDNFDSNDHSASITTELNPTKQQNQLQYRPDTNARKGTEPSSTSKKSDFEPNGTYLPGELESVYSEKDVDTESSLPTRQGPMVEKTNASKDHIRTSSNTVHGNEEASEQSQQQQPASASDEDTVVSLPVYPAVASLQNNSQATVTSHKAGSIDIDHQTMNENLSDEYVTEIIEIEEPEGGLDIHMTTTGAPLLTTRQQTSKATLTTSVKTSASQMAKASSTVAPSVIISKQTHNVNSGNNPSTSSNLNLNSNGDSSNKNNAVGGSIIKNDTNNNNIEAKTLPPVVTYKNEVNGEEIITAGEQQIIEAQVEPTGQQLVVDTSEENIPDPAESYKKKVKVHGARTQTEAEKVVYPEQQDLSQSYFIIRM